MLILVAFVFLVVKVSIQMTDMADWAVVNKIYGEGNHLEVFNKIYYFDVFEKKHQNFEN